MPIFETIFGVRNVSRARFDAPLRESGLHAAAWRDLVLWDFGFLRLIWKNRVQISARAWRSNQPMPMDVAWAKSVGIRTIVNARHDAVRHGGHALVREAAERAEITYLVLDQPPIFSRSAPYRDAILHAATVLQNAEKPLLIHCKSGADRAGFLSALFLIVVEGQSVEEAARELSLRYLHFKGAKTGILDAVFDAYLAIPAERRKTFLDWVREDYDPEDITRDFKTQLASDLLDRLLLRRE
ncbi:COG2365 Protein tyrosine/serine phosphatase [Rhabdaerophilaceae bacterium]